MIQFSVNTVLLCNIINVSGGYVFIRQRMLVSGRQMLIAFEKDKLTDQLLSHSCSMWSDEKTAVTENPLNWTGARWTTEN